MRSVSKAPIIPRYASELQIDREMAQCFDNPMRRGFGQRPADTSLLRSEKGELSLAEQARQAQALKQAEQAKKGVGKIVSTSKTRIGKLRAELTEEAVAFGEMTTAAVSGIYRGTRAAVRRAVEFVTDPLSVGGTLLIAGSLTFAMREDLLRLLNEHDRAVATAEMERQQRIATVASHVQRLADQREIKMDFASTLYVDVPRSVSDAEHLYVVLNDINREHWPKIFEHLRSCGIAVDNAMVTDLSAHSLQPLVYEREGAEEYVTLSTPSSVLYNWNRQYFEHDPEYVDTRSGTPAQRLAKGVRHFQPERHGEPPRRVSVLIEQRLKKGDKSQGSFLDEMRSEKNDFAVAYITKHMPHGFAEWKEKKEADAAALAAASYRAPTFVLPDEERLPTRVAVDDDLLESVASTPPVPQSVIIVRPQGIHDFPKDPIIDFTEEGPEEVEP